MTDLRSVADLRLHRHSGLVPSMTPDEYDEIYADILERGVQTPLDILADGTVLDGRHRYGIATTLGLAEVPVRVVETDDAEGYMVRAAILRRHLTTAQRRHLAAGLLTKSPGTSDRQVAAAVGLSHPTVAAVRDELEDAGQLEEVSSRVGADGRTRPVARDLPPMTDVHRRKFPDLAHAELRAEMSAAIARVRTDLLDPAKWADQLDGLNGEDLALLRSKVAHTGRWVSAWTDLLDGKRALRVIGGDL